MKPGFVKSVLAKVLSLDAVKRLVVRLYDYIQRQESESNTQSTRSSVQKSYAHLSSGVNHPSQKELSEHSVFVIEVDHANDIAGSLFRRRFGCDSFPDTPRHFVLLAKQEDSSCIPLGYVHFERWNSCELCGGLVIDNRTYRLLSLPVRNAIRNAGGVAEILMRESFTRLPPDTTAIFGYVGDKQSEKVCLRVGYIRTPLDYLMVVWCDPDLTQEQKTTLLSDADALGAF